MSTPHPPPESYADPFSDRHPQPAQPGDTLAVRFLEEGGQRATEVAGWLAEFLGRAERSLDLCFYDVRLSEAVALPLRRILAERVRAGVRVRLAYDAGDKPQTGEQVDHLGSDPAPRDTHDRVAELGLSSRAVRAVSGPQSLMHHKYIVRDNADVWTGSLNMTDDSMARMENAILTLRSPGLAAYYARDFLQLWGTGKIVASGNFDTAVEPLTYAGAPASVDVDFSPGRGEAINDWVAERIRAARTRIVICSMLVTSSRILEALVEQLDGDRVEISGFYDRTQMEGVFHQWRPRPDLAWKIAAVERVIAEGRLVGKQSTPYRPDAIHDFQHNKTIVLDDTVLTGSYNFSHNARTNAENILAIASPALAETFVAYTRHLAARYASAPVDGHAASS